MKHYVLLPLLLASAAAQAAPVAKPEKVATCAACHGETGISATGMYPNLAGQFSSYLEHSLKAYQTGERKNAIMGAQAANLTKDEIKALSAWFAQQPGPMFTPGRPSAPGK